MEGLFFQKSMITDQDVLPGDYARTSTLIRRIQGCAESHMTSIGAGPAVLSEKGLFWALTGQHLRICRMPFFGEEIRIETAAGQGRHLLIPRYNAVFSEKTGELLAEGCSVWTAIDGESRKAVHLSDFGINLPEKQISEDIPCRMRIQKKNITAMDVIRVPLSMIDRNGHVNNAVCIDLCTDRIPEEFAFRVPAELTVEYRREIRKDELLMMRWGLSENCCYFTGETEGVCFRLNLMY